jgi:hypothetical protein
LHRVCETIRVLHPNPYKLMASGTKTFVKLPAKTQLFKNKPSDTPFSRTPVVTLWGTCSDVIMYYAENWNLLFCVELIWFGLLLAFATIVVVGFGPLVTHDHIFWAPTYDG